MKARLDLAITDLGPTQLKNIAEPNRVYEVGKPAQAKPAPVRSPASRSSAKVQLIDAESGDHLWAERFDKTVADLFDMQDEIVARLANALNAQLIIAEARRAERAPSPDSMDLL